MSTGYWDVWCPDDGHKGPDDGKRIHGALDAGDAAETWAEDDDREGDHTIVGGSEATVFVRSPSGTITKWTVFGEQVPQYRATEAEA